jgi:pimeloyl-ACP methyl ester carboxylesterase
MDSRSAKAYGPLAAITHRTIYVFGRPRALPRDLTMDNLAARQMALLRERFSEPMDLMGISTGGAIALQLAVDYPWAIRRLVVVAAASWLGNVGRHKLRRYGDHIAQGRSGARILASVLAPPWLAWLAALPIWIQACSERRIDAADMLATIDAECGFDVSARLGGIRATTLVIAGDRDRAFSPELFRATAAGIPGARLVLYSGRGHLGTMFDSRFGRDVAAFLDAPTL